MLTMVLLTMGFTHRHLHQQVPPTSYDAILRLTAATLYLEAGKESNQGKLGVASVIWNRSGGATEIPNVILARKQFSCWNHRKFSSFKPPHNKQYTYCLLVAKDMVDGTFVPPSRYNGAIAYHEKSVRPNWRSGLVRMEQVGNHFFYRCKSWWIFPA